MSSSIQNISIRALIKCRPFTVFMDFFSTSMQKVWSTLMITSCLCKEGLFFVSSRADHSIWGVFYTVPLSENHMLLGVQVQQFKWHWLIWYRLLWRKYFSQLNCSANINLNADTYNIHNLSLSETSPSFIM